MHYTGMPDAESAMKLLTTVEGKVSSHYTIDEDGTIYRHVAEEKRAWHAGVSSWGGADDINSRSIGIEIVNPGHEWGYRPFTQPQIGAVIELSKGIVKRWPITPARVIAHSDVAPERKIDPGELFPWDELARHGIGRWPGALKAAPAASTLGVGADGEKVKRLQSDLARYGYGIEITGLYDERTLIVVSAFQRHFRRSNFDGIADAETQAILADLLNQLDAVA
ncbi:MAG: N-acetylmuramoyl-L-alanine amidase [Alphaproteobacteria bacterium]|nr:N-acetylmuramoyl-L-alanine amidase [Alphaproteobacteria bacterium]